ncbi:MAG: HAMP domain-containing histidine kinase [Candidatus Dormibacteraeota bacterium]|nr:HAMP domain-containing histidine kinase [Candidatus Dormibacteraeota bacterium]
MAPDLSADLEAMNALGHELRRPLTVIRGAATLLLEAQYEMEPESRDEMLRLIDSGAEDMAEMIEDILAAVHIAAGDLSVDLEPVAVAPLIVESVRRARRLDEQREFQVNPGPPGLRVTADRGYTARAVRALLANALVHGAGTIEVRVRREDTDVHMDVLDGGDGLPPDRTEAAFARFARLHAGASGLGLGLYVARGLARAMSGDVTLRERAGGGAWASLTLVESERDS